MGAPVGNRNAASGRGIRRQFEEYAKEHPEHLATVIAVVYEKAMGGDLAAAALVFDRTEGKAAQALIHSNDPDAPISWPLPKSPLDQ